MFFVAEKNGKLRMVLDCRALDHLFKDCPDMPMGSGGTWQELTTMLLFGFRLVILRTIPTSVLFPSSCLRISASLMCLRV